jgi:hypothetical protein
LTNTVFMKAEEVANELDISVAYAYKLIRKLNDELDKKGFLTLSGRISRLYFEEKVYGITSVSKKESE